MYQSLSGRGSSISFEGSIDFVPGSLEAPAGEEFAVAVPRFPLLVGGLPNCNGDSATRPPPLGGMRLPPCRGSPFHTCPA